MKIKPHKNKDAFPWKIRIHDGYVEYEYNLMSRAGCTSIIDIYEVVRKRLKSRRTKGIQVQ